MTFIFDPQAESREISARALIKSLLANKNPEIRPDHLRELLKILLGKITEAHGKYTTRHMSLSALDGGAKLRHDHVYPRSRMVDDLLQGRPEDIDNILKDAIACTVTFDEHSRLSKFDKVHHGWERYRQAKVPVRNTETGVAEVSVDAD
jgi:hypothetical protein